MKILITLVLSIFTFSAFACRPARPLTYDLMLLSGVTKKLSALEFSNYRLVKIQNEEENFRVTLKSTQVEQCLEILMAPTVAADCTSTAEIISNQNADCE